MILLSKLFILKNILQVALIFGIAGALRREEFVNITVDDVIKLEQDVLLIKISKSNNDAPKTFTITDTLFSYCWKYMQARPENCQTNKFFLRYAKGKCTQQSIGINKFATMPKDIAEYLKLPDANEFTGHSFRRTSATLLIDVGAHLTTLKQHRKLKSSSVAFGCIHDSTNNKKGSCDKITIGMNIQKRAKTTNVDTGAKPGMNHGASTSGLNVTPVEGSDSDNEDSASTLRLQENQAITTKTDTTSTLNKINNLKQKISVLVENTSSSDSDDSIQESSGINETRKEQPEPKFPYLYHPDIGFYIKVPTEKQAPSKNYIFNNCTVTINGSNNTFIFNNCIVENQAVKKENNAEDT